MQSEQLLCWSGMTDTEHNGSNEEEKDNSLSNKPKRLNKMFTSVLALLFLVNLFLKSKFYRCSYFPFYCFTQAKQSALRKEYSSSFLVFSDTVRAST